MHVIIHRTVNTRSWHTAQLHRHQEASYVKGAFQSKGLKAILVHSIEPLKQDDIWRGRDILSAGNTLSTHEQRHAPRGPSKAPSGDASTCSRPDSCYLHGFSSTCSRSVRSSSNATKEDPTPLHSTIAKRSSHEPRRSQVRRSSQLSPGGHKDMVRRGEGSPGTYQ